MVLLAIKEMDDYLLKTGLCVMMCYKLISMEWNGHLMFPELYLWTYFVNLIYILLMLIVQ